MKKILYSLLIVFSSYSFGQINLEKTINEEISVYSNNGETYYVTSGWDLSSIKIFDKNFNLYKEFNLNVPNDYTAIVNKNSEQPSAYILSKNIFTLNNKLNIIVFFETKNAFYNYIIKVFDEDGNVVKEFNNNYHFYDADVKFINVFHDETDNTNKLIINSLVDQNTGNKSFTDIYTLPSSTLSLNDTNLINKSLKIHPNPVSSVLTIDNPSNSDTEAKIFDINGRLIKTVTFHKNDKTISVNVSSLVKGNYFIKIGDLVSKIIKN